MSFTRACEPVPLTGASSTRTPRSAIPARARSLAASVSVLASTTVKPPCAPAASPPRPPIRARALFLAASVSVLASTTVSPPCAPAASPSSPKNAASIAASLGSAVITTSASRATALAVGARRPPRAPKRSMASAATSNPVVANPASIRCPAYAEPMIPRPTTPARFATRSRHRGALHGGALARDRRADARHHLGCHQLHRALPERRVGPVVSGVEQRPEVADLRAKREQLLDHGFHGPADHERVQHVVERDRRVRHRAIRFEELRTAVADELGHHRAKVISVRAVVALGVALRRRVVVGDEDALRDAPVRRIGRARAARAALLILRPVRRHPVRLQEVRRDRRPAALRGRDDALRERCDRGG